MKFAIDCEIGAKEAAEIAIAIRSRLKKEEITEEAISLVDGMIPFLEPFCEKDPRFETLKSSIAELKARQ